MALVMGRMNSSGTRNPIMASHRRLRAAQIRTGLCTRLTRRVLILFATSLSGLLAFIMAFTQYLRTLADPTDIASRSRPEPRCAPRADPGALAIEQSGIG